MKVDGMNSVGMKCAVATTPSLAYVTTVKCVSDHTSHSLPSLYLDRSSPGSASEKQVMRPFWLLAPKLPRKYPLTATSPNFGFGGGGATTGAAAGGGTGSAGNTA